MFLACHVLEPQFDYAFQELRSEMYVERSARSKELLERWAKIGMAPPNRMAARVVLLGIIDDAIAGLKGLEAELQAKDAEAQREREACPSDEDQKAGQQVERHQGSCNRLIFGNLNAIHKLRRNEADGWGKARQQREQKSQGKKRSTPVDHRSVVDERGVVRPAYGYDGDLEEGLARFEAEFGRTGMNKPWEEFEATHLRAVPDYARFVANQGREEGGSGGEVTVSDVGGEVGQGARGENGFLGGEVANEEVESVTQVLMETVRESNLQNEICDGQPSDFRMPILDFGLKAAADGVKWSGARPGQREFLFGRGRRDSAGGSSALEIEGASRKRRLTGRFLKRDAKRWRKVRAKLEVIRRTGVGSEAEIAALKQSVEEPDWWHPNSVDTHHEHVARLPLPLPLP